MTKLRTVGIVAAFIAACGAGGFIAGAALDERCRTDTATMCLNDEDAALLAKAAAVEAASAIYEAAVKAAEIAYTAYYRRLNLVAIAANTVEGDDEAATDAAVKAATDAADAALAVYKAVDRAVEAAFAVYIEALTD